MTAFTRDLKQAYVQSETALERNLYLKPPKKIVFGQYAVLKVMHPLHGIPYSGLHWSLTYLDHHTGSLNMHKKKVCPFLLVHHDQYLAGIIIMQVDDSFAIVRDAFIEEE